MAGLDDRRTFLHWLGCNHEFKAPGALEVVRSLVNSPRLLERLRLIEDLSYLRPLIVISTVSQAQPGLIYQTGIGSTQDPSTVMIDLKLTDGPVYLAAYFPARLQSHYYLAAREAGTEPSSAAIGWQIHDLEARQLIAGLELQAKRLEILRLIDQALERRDRAAFLELTTELKKIPGGREPGASLVLRRRGF